MALGHHEQDGDCGTTIIQGFTADISHVVDFMIGVGRGVRKNPTKNTCSLVAGMDPVGIQVMNFVLLY